ncbi:hypothetical protein [Streptomyces minutiscleroticus]|uniref:hypothetical protein n=1 Tax=Streptomyces minutiscleroticus TaxID=68238 RepID=UPI00167EFFC7|nr:hypothetical protein [Streptomyces minutiscleroticus]
MTVEQLPRQVREFAGYLRELAALLDQGGGWYGVFRQRDPDGMRACLDGAEVPPWDVVEALLQDFAAAYGAEAAARETERARALHRASSHAHDARPGGRDALGDRLDIMLREQRYAAERQEGLARALSVAATAEESDALRRDLAWARDDHERATARCAELRTRMEVLDRRSWGGPARQDPGAASGDGAPLAFPPGSGATVFRREAHGTADAPPGGEPSPEPRPVRHTAAGVPSAGAPAAGAPSAKSPAAARDASVPALPVPAPYGPEGQWSEASGPEAPGPEEYGPEAPASASAVREAGEARGDGAAGGGPDGPGAAARRLPGQRGRRRLRGGARFAGMPEEGGAAVAPVPEPPAPAAPARRTPRGARFAGAAQEASPAQSSAGAAAGLPDPAEEARGIVAETVGRLVRLRAEGRSGEAHALLAEAVSWPADRLPALAAALDRAGLGADRSTLLWEAASLPPARLVAAADALVAAGRAADGEQLLRQGVVRPAEEIGEAVLVLAAEGRDRAVRALLDAHVRMRTPAEAAQSASPDPGRLVPLLLEAAGAVSEERHWDLVHALRVAGFTA